MAQLKIPLDAQRFATGMTWKDYLAQMGDMRARTEENYQHAALDRGRAALLRAASARRATR